MVQEKKTKRIKMVRLQAHIHPVHEEKMKAEIDEAEKQGRVITQSEIIREELDGRYLTKRRKADRN